ncbi:MAG: heme o synthase [Rhodospirillales bacterium]|nr:heme o synthase [Rhodospirillales bacterium]
MNETTPPSEPETRQPDNDGPRLRVLDYALLLKPRVMSLVVFTAFVGLFLAPGEKDWLTDIIAVLCIAAGAGASGAINMWYDRDIDIVMKRTAKRPIPAGRMDPRSALIFGVVLSAVSVAVMALMVNKAAAGLLAFTVFYYVIIYTVWLKRRTPQNIVIGGAAGAFPPMIGYIAATGHYGPEAGMLFAIIFLWTPPHSWALALFSNADYARAGVPMLPVVAGEKATKAQMAFYTALLIPATLSPVYLKMSGAIYGLAALILGIGFVWHMIKVWRDTEGTAARPMFFYSIYYLFLIFVFLMVDRALFIPVMPG